MIRTFRNKDTEALFRGRRVKRFQPFRSAAERKLIMIEAATALSSLASPPGNRLEALSGDRRGQHSIRINDQWRICFVWKEDGAHEVEIVDYH